MSIVKLSANQISRGLHCPGSKRRIEHCDKDLPSHYLERHAIPAPLPVPTLVPVHHGRTCKCDENAKKNILDLTSPQISLMASGEERKARQLFERECWNSLLHAQQIEVGNCIVCLVAQGLLPLENLGASPRTANHVVYRKIPT